MPILNIRVQPRARRQAHAWERDTLRVWLTAAPTDGQANEALISYLADAVGLAKSKLKLISGERHRNKRVEFDGLTLEELKARLQGS